MSVRHTHVLVVDDNDDNREIFTTILEHAGHQVTHAATGTEGLRLALATHPDVVLLDLHLPEVDGWEVARRLLAEPAPRTAHILIVTAHAQPEDRLRAREVGCADLLEKPIDPRELRAAVAALLEEANANASASARAPVRDAGARFDDAARTSRH